MVFIDDMRSAPRDGTPVLGYDPSRDGVDECKFVVMRWEDSSQGWFVHSNDGLGDFAKPTHWAHLIEAPA